MDDRELKELERWTERIMERARREGLDFYDMRFEVVPADVLYAFGAYGMPTRFSHWSFGKAYHRMKTEYDYNLSRIYELVINSNPCYAFLLDGNSLVQNKLVVAHVLAHSDFFKNNYRFRTTAPHHTVETMAAHAERIARYEFQYGREEVEQILDAALSLAEQVDPHPVGPRSRKTDELSTAPPSPEPSRPRTPYDDLWALDERLKPRESEPASASTNRPRRVGFVPERERSGPEGQSRHRRRRARGLPEHPEKDLLLFLMEHSDYLEPWQRDVLAMVREEMLYFWPQLETKVMNEGWATYWHLRLIRDEEMPEQEALEFARMHAGVIQPHRLYLNPYLLGLKVWESIEKRWNEPTREEQERFGRMPGQGRAKMFEVRELETDVSFLSNYLTEELVEELNLFVFARHGDDWQVESTDWKQVRDTLVARLTHGGIPYIVVADGDYRGAGELLLQHVYEGTELDLRYLEKTLPYVYRLWGRPVHLETVVDEKPVLFSFDGEQQRRTELKDR